MRDATLFSVFFSFLLSLKFHIKSMYPATEPTGGNARAVCVASNRCFMSRARDADTASRADGSL
jgi:hypothetical protein